AKVQKGIGRTDVLSFPDLVEGLPDILPKPPGSGSIHQHHPLHVTKGWNVLYGSEAISIIEIQRLGNSSIDRVAVARMLELVEDWDLLPAVEILDHKRHRHEPEAQGLGVDLQSARCAVIKPVQNAAMLTWIQFIYRDNRMKHWPSRYFSQ